MIIDYKKLRKYFPNNYNEICKKFSSKDPLEKVEAFLELTYYENKEFLEKKKYMGV